MEKVKLGCISPQFPFFLNDKGILYLKIYNVNDIYYRAFHWREPLRQHNGEYGRPVFGPCVEFRETDLTDVRSEVIAKPLYTSREVEEFLIDDEHHLSTKAIYHHLKGVGE